MATAANDTASEAPQVHEFDEADDREYTPRDLLEVEQAPLIKGRRMTCPRCEQEHDILDYVPMQVIKKFASETNPIYKCPSCRWIFSPQPRFLEDQI